MFKNIKVNNDEPLIEDVTREFNKGSGRLVTRVVTRALAHAYAEPIDL